MSELITNKILNFITHYKKLESNDIQIYTYGILLILSDLSNFLIILVPSLFLHKLSVGIVFITIFCLIRRYSGGYHCSSNIKCNITYLMIYIMMLLMLQQPNFINSQKINILYYLSSIFIIFLAPISRNRYFNEKILIKNKVLTINGVILTILLKSIVNKEYSFVITYVVICVFLLMLIELLFRRWKNEFYN